MLFLKAFFLDDPSLSFGLEAQIIAIAVRVLHPKKLSFEELSRPNQYNTKRNAAAIPCDWANNETGKLVAVILLRIRYSFHPHYWPNDGQRNDFKIAVKRCERKLEIIPGVYVLYKQLTRNRRIICSKVYSLFSVSSNLKRANTDWCPRCFVISFVLRHRNWQAVNFINYDISLCVG